MKIRSFKYEDKPGVIEPWRKCGLLRPWNDPEKDIDRKLEDSPDFFWLVFITIKYEHQLWVAMIVIEDGLII